MSRRLPDGERKLYAGASGCGKTTAVDQATRADGRLLVWDAKCEWGGRKFRCRTVRDFRELHRACLPGAPAERIAFQCQVTRENFETFARLAWVWIRATTDQRPVLVVEELGDVSPPGKAPPAWGEIVRKSRSYGAMVYALTQRPAESDKTILGNASLIWCGRLTFADDCRYMANCLRVPVADVEALQGFEYIEKNLRTGSVIKPAAGGRRRRA